MFQSEGSGRFADRLVGVQRAGAAAAGRLSVLRSGVASVAPQVRAMGACFTVLVAASASAVAPLIPRSAKAASAMCPFAIPFTVGTLAWPVIRRPALAGWATAVVATGAGVITPAWPLLPGPVAVIAPAWPLLPGPVVVVTPEAGAFSLPAGAAGLPRAAFRVGTAARTIAVVAPGPATKALAGRGFAFGPAGTGLARTIGVVVAALLPGPPLSVTGVAFAVAAAPALAGRTAGIAAHRVSIIAPAGPPLMRAVAVVTSGTRLTWTIGVAVATAPLPGPPLAVRGAAFSITAAPALTGRATAVASFIGVAARAGRTAAWAGRTGTAGAGRGSRPGSRAHLESRHLDRHPGRGCGKG